MKLHGILLLVVCLVGKSFPNMDVEKSEFCSRLNCRSETRDTKACGLRAEGEGFRLKLFQNECELLKYGCSVEEENDVSDRSKSQKKTMRRIESQLKWIITYSRPSGLAVMSTGALNLLHARLHTSLTYGLINIEYCNDSFGTNYNETANYMKNESQKLENVSFFNATDKCGVACDNKEKKEVCGIRADGNGYRIRLFQNYCDLIKHNCENYLEFIKTDLFICESELNNIKEENLINDNTVAENVLNGLSKNKFENYKNAVDDLEKANKTYYKDLKVNKTDNNVKNLIVVNSKIFGNYDNINDSIDTFFAASHVFDLPLKEIQLNTRRKLMKYAGPIKVFVPWIAKPKSIANDTFHRPTLSSCYHKCPYKCPETYAPVCGVPGVVAREPSLMFQNHCFMDVAQCKMFWENKSSTSHSSYYVESSFLFCMGDEMNAVYRFLPAIRTLQHMGRLKKKGKFRAVLRNFRFVSEFRYGRPKFMG